MQITFSYVDSENVQADFSRTCYPCLTTLMNAGFTVKVAYDTVRSLGIAEVGPVIDLLHELEAQRADGCVRTPLGRRLRRVPQRTYQRLRESEERLRLILANSPDTIVYSDRTLRVTEVFNPHAPLLADAMIGKTERDYLPPEEAERFLALRED